MKSFTVKVSKETFDLVQSVAIAYGYSWINWTEKPKPTKYISGLDYIHFDGNSKELSRTSLPSRDFNRTFEEIKLEDLVDRLENKLPDIIIDGIVVEFLPNGDIKVGCTTVSKKTIEDIYNRSHAD
jgi:hypothetical protein